MPSPEMAAPPILPWHVKLSCSLMGTVTDVSFRKDGTVNRTLVRLLDLRSPTYDQPVMGVATADYTFDPATGVWFRLFTPSGISEGEKLPVIVYLHGGGFTFFAASSVHYEIICRMFARRLRAFVVSVSYRLAPEHRFPVAYDDAEAAVRWISEPGRLPRSADVGRCFLVGDSSGGNMVHHLGCRIAASSSDFLPLRVLGHVLIQPFFGGEERTPSENRLRDTPIVGLHRMDCWWRAFLPKGSDRDHPAANVTGPRAPDVAVLGLPPSLVVTSGFDSLQDRCRLYHDRLREAGVQSRLLEYPNTIHGFYVFQDLPESGELLAEIKAFMEEPNRGERDPVALWFDCDACDDATGDQCAVSLS